jgi:hypothetical protein
MHDTSNETPSIDWVRAHFGIEDEDELRAALAAPNALLALLDVAQAAAHDGISVARTRSPHSM